jgi:hypothetical protein
LLDKSVKPSSDPELDQQAGWRIRRHACSPKVSSSRS